MKIFLSAGHEVDTCIIPAKSLSSAKEKSKKYDYCIELNFNAYNGSDDGSEVLYYSNVK